MAAAAAVGGIGTGTGMGDVAVLRPAGTRGAEVVGTEAAEGETGGDPEMAAGGSAAAVVDGMLAGGTTQGLGIGSRGTVAKTTTGTRGARSGRDWDRGCDPYPVWDHITYN